MDPKKYTLTWQLHSDYLSNIMREMMASEDFTDVTLVTDDMKTIKAHRNILSACSPVFKNILQMKINNNHPVIYLRGIQYVEIESILQFIYLGEAKFHEERINEFLSVSRDLKIQELSKYEETNKTHTRNQNQEDITDTVNVEHNNSTEEEKGTTIESEPANKKEVIFREMTSVGSKFKCPHCPKLFSQNSSVHKHIRSVHEGVKYACNQCEKQYPSQDNLIRHIQSIHEGVKYACDQCDYEAAERGKLTKHIQSMHEGVKYPCNWCEYQATFQHRLTTHIQSKHEGVKYAHKMQA